MLWIAKVTAGVAVDGNQEHSVFVVDESSNVFEVTIDEGIHDQLLEIIAQNIENRRRASAGGDSPSSDGGVGTGTQEDAVMERLAGLIASPAHSMQTPEHSIDDVREESDPNPMSLIGFDDTEYEEEDPGEEVLDVEDRYVDQL